MPVPFLLAGAAGIAGATGLFKGAKAILNNSDAENLIYDAQTLYDNAKNKLEVSREKSTQSLENLGVVKLDAWANDMKTFVDTFHCFKNVRLEGNVEINERLKLKIQNPENLKNIEIAAMNACEITQAGIASLGAGALAGIASYGGAMMFASASTGTAIATLSGVAAKNATLAWFGGGAIKAGGLGMAGGSAVLGGIVAGPVLAVAGCILEAKSAENLAKAKKTYAEAENAAEQMGVMTDFMNCVANLSNEYAAFTTQYQKLFRPVLNRLNEIKNLALVREKAKRQSLFAKLFSKKDEKIDFDNLTSEEQETLHLAWLMAQVFYSILSAPILTDDGEMDDHAESTLLDAQDALCNIEESKYSLKIDAECDSISVDKED